MKEYSIINHIQGIAGHQPGTKPLQLNQIDQINRPYLGNCYFVLNAMTIHCFAVTTDGQNNNQKTITATEYMYQF